MITLSASDYVVLSWSDATAKWRSAAKSHIAGMHSVALRPGNVAPDQWVYLYLSAGNAGEYNRSDNGWNPIAINNAAAAYSAGLHIQEYISAVWHTITGDNWDLATVLYDFDNTSSISGAISPDAHVSTILPAEEAFGARWATTGEWKNSAIPTPTKSFLAPHLYTRYHTALGSGTLLQQIHARYRWVGTP